MLEFSLVSMFRRARIAFFVGFLACADWLFWYTIMHDRSQECGLDNAMCLKFQVEPGFGIGSGRHINL